jgi:serine/threonine protein phosphatase PrpC
MAGIILVVVIFLLIVIIAIVKFGPFRRRNAAALRSASRLTGTPPPLAGPTPVGPSSSATTGAPPNNQLAQHESDRGDRRPRGAPMPSERDHPAPTPDRPARDGAEGSVHVVDTADSRTKTGTRLRRPKRLASWGSWVLGRVRRRSVREGSSREPIVDHGRTESAVEESSVGESSIEESPTASSAESSSAKPKPAIESPRPGSGTRPGPPSRLADTELRHVGPAPRPAVSYLPPSASSWSLNSSGPSYAADGGMLKYVTVRAASCRGRGHAFEGERRQDAYAIEMSEGGHWLVAAVADGVGSSAHADRAARLSASTAVTLAVRELDDHPNTLLSEESASKIMEGVATALVEQRGRWGPAERGTNSRRAATESPATTLTVAVVPADGRQDGEALVLAVGNSPALVLEEQGWRWLVGRPEGTDRPGSLLRSQLTKALPQAPHELVRQTVAWRRDSLLVLLTDGIAEAFGDGTARLAEELRISWRRPPTMLEFIRDVDYRLSTYNDDRTAVAMWFGRLDERVA